MAMENSKYYWIGSHKNTSNDSQWLRSNLYEFDAKTEKIMKLIDGDEAESFAKRVEALYVKRPELIAMIEDFYRLHCSMLVSIDRLKRSDAKTPLTCSEDDLSENSEVTEIDESEKGEDGEKEMKEEIERLRRENRVYKEMMREKDEEKTEVIRQLSMTIDMLKTENFELKKNLSCVFAIAKTKKKQTWNSLGFVRNPLKFVQVKLGLTF